MAAWTMSGGMLVLATMWLIVATVVASSSSPRDPLLGLLQAGGRSIQYYQEPPKKKQQHIHYISYGALSADRVPCAPMSGRSYYTPNCVAAKGPPDCYARRCSTITRCARDS
ncbi:hypothetical protein SELMODRAFT_427463 [Selaginella moellendorffii]|uniref:Uncharacterized protein n=1 Tax=Selaginella moellendorffii TaxID=88036 RepID=D8SZP7_SELML|nr:protein RALF-like 19 [Selaginella moellendorffii]EFJ10058.1 hypothetical protein SELMODRAFT_427463 [Selaginella moellendorffii]|eukprot:XP_002988796.1 protein RALF-like 19 [Selaginella moellendorffii]